MPPRPFLFPQPGFFTVRNGQSGGAFQTRGFGWSQIDDDVEYHRFLLTRDYRPPGPRYSGLLRFYPASGIGDLQGWQNAIRDGQDYVMHEGCEDHYTGRADDHTEWNATGRAKLVHGILDPDSLRPDAFEYVKETVTAITAADLPPPDAFKAKERELEPLQIDPQWLIGIYFYGSSVPRGVAYAVAGGSADRRMEYWAVSDLAEFQRVGPVGIPGAGPGQNRVCLERKERMNWADARVELLRSVPTEDGRLFQVEVQRWFNELPQNL
jgi:hypothetical protein